MHQVFHYDCYSQVLLNKSACVVKRFEETRPGRDVCNQCYVRADTNGTALARACEVCVLPNLGPAESAPTAPTQISFIGNTAEAGQVACNIGQRRSLLKSSHARGRCG